MAEHDAVELSEPDPLGLRPLLAEVIDRIEGVASLADRLQALLEAVVAIGSQLALDDVLTRIVGTAADLVDAKFGALGVLDPGGDGLSQFITVGMDQQTQKKLGDLPRGRGVLGVLIDHPQAIRLNDIRDHPASFGFPPNHPPMRTFLGVPISVKGEAFGNLYLTDKRSGGPFTAADEQMVLALATAAGLAVQNARLYEQAQRRQQWLQAIGDLTMRLLDGASARDIFPDLVATARRLVRADVAFLALPMGDGRLRVEVADGTSAEVLDGGVIPENSLAAAVMRDGMPALVQDAMSDPRIWPDLLKAAGVGPAMYVPLGTVEAAVGTLVVAHIGAKPPFTKELLQLVEGFAGQAAVALRLGAAAADREQLAVLEDRDRIARDLHDLVIQRLFATGMALEGALRSLPPGPASARVRQAVDDLDGTIREIRTTVFALHATAHPADDSLRTAVLHAARAAAPALGFEPHLDLDGPVDSLVPGTVGEHLLAVLRESLSNIARHAGATSVEISLHASPHGVRLVVSDDGVGLPDGGRKSGLANISVRADALGGRCSAERRASGGTVITWEVPLTHVSAGTDEVGPNR